MQKQNNLILCFDENQQSKWVNIVTIKNKKVKWISPTLVASQTHLWAKLVARCKTSGTMKHNEQQNSKVKD
jgi:hypothetical protein